MSAFQALFLHDSLVPSKALVDRMAEIDAVNPFCTTQFLEARTQQGDQPCLFHLNNQNEMAAGCFGFLRGKFLRRSLQIVSLPRLPDADSFWHGLWEFCLQSRIWHLQVDSYASPEAQIPILPGETARRERFEYILDLSSEDFQKRVSTNHGRNISRAVSAGLVIRRARESEALTDHVSLMRSSLDRRMKRGEQVELDEDASLLLALLSCNAGELFQAVENTRVVASVLVLRSQTRHGDRRFAFSDLGRRRNSSARGCAHLQFGWSKSGEYRPAPFQGGFRRAGTTAHSGIVLSSSGHPAWRSKNLENTSRKAEGRSMAAWPCGFSPARV